MTCGASSQHCQFLSLAFATNPVTILCPRPATHTRHARGDTPTEKFGTVKEKFAKELNRLKGMAAKKMKPEQTSWLSRRMTILSKFIEKKTEDL